MAEPVARGGAQRHGRIYRTYWSILNAADPSRTVAKSDRPLIEADPELTRPLETKMYVRDIVFTTGIVEAGEHYILASGGTDIACRNVHF